MYKKEYKIIIYYYNNNFEMETKEELVNNIKEWMKIENEIKVFQKEIKERKSKINILTQSLIEVMKKNEIECFDIKGGSLIYKKNKTKKPINTVTLKTTLNKYFTNHPEKAEDITRFILENREEVVKEVLKHKIDK